MKNVLVLGASGDIGSTISTDLAIEGYQLILHYFKNKSSIENTLNIVDETKILQTIQADLSNMEEVHRLCEEIAYSVDAIVFVSGNAQFGLFQQVKETDMEKMLTLHVRAPWIITQAFLPAMIKNKSGKIIFITSIWGDVGASNEVIYSSVKGAQNSFVRALAKEIGPSGVSVNAVSPGFIDTKMNKHLQNEEKEAIISNIPLNRAGLASDVSHTVSFLMDEKSSYIQGEIVHITGGW